MKHTQVTFSFEQALLEDIACPFNSRPDLGLNQPSHAIWAQLTRSETANHFTFQLKVFINDICLRHVFQLQTRKCISSRIIRELPIVVSLSVDQQRLPLALERNTAWR